MTITFDKAAIRTEGQEVWLALRLPYDSRQEARRFVLTMKDKLYTAVFKLFRRDRSLDANAYYWKMCGEIARALGVRKEEVYRRHVQDMEIYDVLCMKTDKVEGWERKWVSGHLGRMIETRASKWPGYTTVLAYYGSSDFDTAEMSRLIDNCLQDCAALGIETLSERERSLLLEGWNEAQRDKGDGDPR